MTTTATPLDTSTCARGQCCYVDPDYGIMLCPIHAKAPALLAAIVRRDDTHGFTGSGLNASVAEARAILA